MTRNTYPFKKENFWKTGTAFLLIIFVMASFLSHPQTVSADRSSCAIPGDDGPVTISAAGTIVNTYYPGTGSMSAGATSITVDNANRQGASAQIATGDLLLVIQMQGAAIDYTQTDSYGDGVAGTPASGNLDDANFTAGHYEYVMATSTATTGTVTINTPLTYDYTTAAATTTQGQQSFQVIRIPQYSNLTINSGGSITAYSWSGAVGGVVAFDVAGTLSLNSGTVVNVAGQGFRAGGGRTVNGSGGTANTDYRTSSITYLQNGSKGEGTAGTPRYLYVSGTTSVTDQGSSYYGYPSSDANGGDMGRGAPGNAGGGGTDGNPAANDQNTGGGGGGNGGAGGLGGFAWYTVIDAGGFGGAQFSVASPARLVMGGGGGAGTINNNVDYQSSGGSGGGIVMIRAGTVSGSGTISADGSAAPGQPLNDSGGGGGAGGSVLVLAQNSALPSGLNISANGGRGGDAWPTHDPGTPGELTVSTSNQRHGPGGGGGGGVIFLSSMAGTLSVAHGAHGITTSANSAFGSQDGNDGIVGTSTTPTDLTGGIAGATCPVNTNVVKTTSTPVLTQTATGVTGTYTITVSNPASNGGTVGVTISDTLPTNFTYSSTGTINLTGGALRTSTSDPGANSTTPAWGVFYIPSGGSVAITFNVKIAAGTTGIFQNPATATYSDPLRTTTDGTASKSYDPFSSTGEDITLYPAADLAVTKDDSQPAVTYGTDTTYTLTLTNNGPSAADGSKISDPAATGLTKSSIGACVASSGAVCPTVGDGDGELNIANLEAGTVVVPTLPAGGSISFTVTDHITATSGSVTNTFTATAPSGTTDTNTSNNTASDTDQIVEPPHIDKAFAASEIVVNGTTSLTFTIQNPNSSTNFTGVTFSDGMPYGLVVSDGTFNNQCGAESTVTTSASSNTVTLTNGSIAASDYCQFSVTVKGATAGVKNNTTDYVSSTEGGQGNQAIASITVDPPTAVEMTSFAAQWQQSSGVALSWSTVQEVNIIGFNIYRRANGQGDWTLVTPSMIPSKDPGSLFGATYTFTDASAVSQGWYEYRVDCIDTAAAVSSSLTVVVFTNPYQMFLPLLMR